jgi:hypothetical protein
VHAIATACPSCKSTERDGLTNAKTEHQPGVKNGVRFSHVKRARTRCRACGQRYVIVEYENKYESRTEDWQSEATDPPAGL